VDTINAAADSTNKVLSLPDIDGLSSTCLSSCDWKTPAENWWDEFLLASSKPETLDWEKSNWYTT
jgi:hypothetical protein